MTMLDLAIVVMLAVSLYVGYRRGAVVQVMGVGGMILGVAAGMTLVPRIVGPADSPYTAVAFALGTVLVAGAIGNMVGYLVGSSIRRKTHDTPLRRADALGGSVLSAAALLAVTWFLALNLSKGPFPVVARGLRESAIVRTLDSTLPPPPSQPPAGPPVAPPAPPAPTSTSTIRARSQLPGPRGPRGPTRRRPARPR